MGVEWLDLPEEKDKWQAFKSFPYSLNLLETCHVVVINDGTES